MHHDRRQLGPPPPPFKGSSAGLIVGRRDRQGVKGVMRWGKISECDSSQVTGPAGRWPAWTYSTYQYCCNAVARMSLTYNNNDITTNTLFVIRSLRLTEMVLVCIGGRCGNVFFGFLRMDCAHLTGITSFFKDEPLSLNRIHLWSYPGECRFYRNAKSPKMTRVVAQKFRYTEGAIVTHTSR